MQYVNGIPKSRKSESTGSFVRMEKMPSICRFSKSGNAFKIAKKRRYVNAVNANNTARAFSTPYFIYIGICMDSSRASAKNTLK